MIQFPLISKCLSIVPNAIVGFLDDKFTRWFQFEKMTRKYVADARRDKANGSDISARPTVLRHLVNCDLPSSEMQDDRLCQEAQSLIGAGTFTTASILSFISYQLIANERVRSTLKEELDSVMVGYPETIPSWSQLEQLPYLCGVVKEGLRLSYGVVHRLPRISPDIPIRYKTWNIPRGVPVGMSSYYMHNDPDTYASPLEFLPERWLNDSPGSNMNRNLVPFTRGSRACLGMHLASAELYLTIAILFRPNGPAFELFDTDESDVRVKHDFFIGVPKMDTKGVRVRVS